MARRKFLVPEVIQTSAMDCGPACLKAFLEGFGVRASYGRLREACQTDVDGTSIDAIEETALRLGLEAEQRMVPLDHLLVAESRSLPAIVVVLRSDRTTHFVLVWRTHGPWLQVMDPSVGRRWIRRGEFLRGVFRHTQSVPAEGWREWAGSPDFERTLRRRMANLGVSVKLQAPLVEEALRDPEWRGLARLDAAVRMSAALVEGGAVREGDEAARLTATLAAAPERIPQRYWSVQAEEQDDAALSMRGVVLLNASGCESAADEGLSPELRAALTEPRPNPLKALWRIAREEGLAAPAALTGAAALAAAGVIFEALLFRWLLNASHSLPLAAIAAFPIAMLLLEWPLEVGVLRMGRKLENRFRVWFLTKIPRLGDRYFQSRLVSDMAQRAHNMHLIRGLPALAMQTARASFGLLFTVAGIAWLYPRAAPLAILAAIAAAAVPLLAQRILGERDLRLREHEGALSLYFFDSLRGLAAIRAHGSAPLLRRAQGEKLLEWADAGLRLQRAVVAVEGVQMAVIYALAAALMFSHQGGMLLLAYWVLGIPALGQELAAAVWQYPGIRNIALRLLEPLGAPEDEAGEAAQSDGLSGGVEIRMEHVSVVAAGQTILEDVGLHIAPGEHVAIVGLSGAGKSSLAGLLLGWHRAARGRVLVDGKALDASRLERMRRETAWLDPEVRLWNESLGENLAYGNAGAPSREAISEAALDEVIRRLPEGMETRLGEGGGFLSAGEGQRVRIGRSLLRDGVRLAVLDEPVRGLEHERRTMILERLRERWRGATLLCITHDVADTRGFERVLVIEQGRIVEDGDPQELLENSASRYRALFDAEEAARTGIWGSSVWRRLRMQRGKLEEAEERRAWAQR